MFSVSLIQVILMFLLMLIGALANKLHFFHEQTIRDLTNILLMIVSPCLIIKSFARPFSPVAGKQLLLITGGVFLVYCVVIALSSIFFKKIPLAEDKRIVLNFSTIYSNAGFMGIPLVAALFKDQGVLLAVPSLALFNIFNWTHGENLFTSQQDGINLGNKLIKLLLNPNIIAIILGSGIFLLNFKLPAVLNQGITYISNLNTPLAMMVIGNGLADINLKTLFTDRWSWIGVFLRNILVPIIMLSVLIFWHLDTMSLTVSVVMAACPVPGIVVLFSLMNDKDRVFPTRLMSLSTLFSMLTLPLMISATDYVTRFF